MSTQEYIQEDTIISKGPLLIFTVLLVKMAKVQPKHVPYI